MGTIGTDGRSKGYNVWVRRFPRILLNATTVLSLLLFVATVVVWVGSYVGQEIIDLGGGAPDLATFQKTGTANYVVVLHRGALLVARFSLHDPATRLYYLVA